jgi:cyclophilin family peptidyl-prolyl cis-trans isomerase
LEALTVLSARSAPTQEEFVGSQISVPMQVVVSARSSDELVLRRAGFSLELSLAVAGGDVSALTRLLDESTSSEDAGLPVVAAIVLASRSEEIVEGALLDRLDSADPLVAGIVAAALGERDGAHITQRLVTAYSKASAPPKWALREALAVALLGRSGLPPASVIQMRDDPSAAVRLAVYRHAISAEERVDLGPVPQELPLRDLPDAAFGVGNVRGARVVTSRGTLELVLFPDVAPGAVANFVNLAERGFYSDLFFHRVVPDFVVQAGDPTGTGWGGPGYSIRDEFSSRPFLRGSLGMARSEKDTAGSQWFITHSRQPHLDRHYTLFGQLSGGWDVLDGIAVGDRIESITIDRRSP